MRRTAAALTFLVLALLASCGRVKDEPAVTEPAEAALSALEARLLRAEALLMRYRVRAAGPFQAEIEGELEIRNGDVIALSGSGTFNGAAVEIHLAAADGTLRGGSDQSSFQQPVPPELRAALVLGLTRMGILHNLARLSSGQPPDHAEGGIAGWVHVVDVSWASLQPSRPTLGFGIQVDGQRVGDATLTLNGDRQPIHRDQEVRFPGGAMQVTEEYEILQLYP